MANGPPLPPAAAKNHLPDSQAPANAELAINFYNAARAEILQRLSMRETTFLAWITVVGAILSFAATHPPDGKLFEPQLLQLIPLLCLPFGLAIYRHSVIITLLGDYLRNELGGHLSQAENATDRKKQDAPPHWDNSRTLSKKIRGVLVVEGIAYTFFLVGVPVGCLIYVHWVAPQPCPDWWLLVGSLSTAIVFCVGVYLVMRDFLGAGRLWSSTRGE